MLSPLSDELGKIGYKFEANSATWMPGSEHEVTITDPNGKKKVIKDSDYKDFYDKLKTGITDFVKGEFPATQSITISGQSRSIDDWISEYKKNPKYKNVSDEQLRQAILKLNKKE